MASPLTAEDKAALDGALKDIAEAKAILARAKLAGLDMSAEEARLTELEAQARGLKAAFFPTGRG